MQVLLIDDDPSIRAALGEILEDEGYVVAQAVHGQDALEQLRATARPPGVILLDLAMPIMSGWAFRAVQQRDPALARIPVVILSADRRAREIAADLEVAEYLEKPVDIDLLIGVVARYIHLGV
ncbi:MAG TPA: response regulator [Kouleothrix sp.]|uniref:response regulator n=1 Tax=Kouleothrix sp. TaxID=2779161 RepID=UPI002CCCDCAB|nr:response regulator [Kouleothrix sp.]HRC77492.1 response regulator [Kouleothrix sp.]